MRLKFGLRAKFTILFLIFAMVMTAFIGYMTYYNYHNNVMEQIVESAVGYANIAASVIEGKDIIEYKEKTVAVIEQNLDETLRKNKLSEYVKDKNYKNILTQLNNIKTQSGVLYLYVMSPISDNKAVFLFDAYTPEEDVSKYASLGFEQEYSDELYSTAKIVMETGKESHTYDVTESVYGRVLSVYAPILESSGKAVAFVGIDYSVEEIETSMESFLYQIIMFTVGIIVICFLILLLLVHLSIIHPIRVLKKKVDELADGNLGVEVPIRGRDEISDISFGFNRMSKNIEGHVREMEGLNNGYYKFVPSEIFEILHKASVTDVVLGDQEEVEFAITSMETVDFSNIIRKMTSKEMFNLINAILNPCVGAVKKYHGVVEKFEDAGLTAFYTNRTENALVSSISICHKILEINKNRGFCISNDIKASIAITYGRVMIGVVGHQDRLATVTISEQTAMAEFLRSKATKYFYNIVITATAANKISYFDSNYNSRFIGFLYITATNRMEKLYDVFDGDNQQDKALKAQTKEIFEKGVNLYCAKNFIEARQAFIEVLKIFRRDSAAREYLYLCNEYYLRKDTQEIPIYIEAY